MTGREPRPLDRSKPDRSALGRAGEDAAARFLERRGYRILARNVRADGVELDLVVRRGPTLAIVEVKTRSNRWAGAPEEAVDARKQARLVRGGRAWSHAHATRTRRIRFDVVTCEVAETGFRVRHWEGAFDASD